MTLLPFIIVLFVSLYISVWASRQKAEYFLAGRSIGFLPLFGTFLGTQVGVGFVIGGTDAVWSQGILGSLYGLGLAIGMIVLACGYSSRLRKFHVKTLPNLLGNRYGCLRLRRFASLTSVLSLSGILVAQAVGLKRFLIALGAENQAFFLFSWASVVFYTTFGGFLAVVWTDLLQAVGIIIILCFAFFFSLLPQFPEIMTYAQSMTLDFSDHAFSAFIMPVLYIFISEHMAQRSFAAKSPSVASKASLFTGISLTILSIIPFACGILGKSMHLTLDHGSIFMQVMQHLSSPALFAFITTAVLLAIISTTSSILLAISSNATQDTNMKPETGRWITLCVGIIAVLGSFFEYDIITWIVLGYELSVGALLVPLLIAVYSKHERLPQEAAWAAAACGLLGVYVSHLVATGLLFVFLPLIFSSLGYIGGWFYGKSKQMLARESVID